MLIDDLDWERPNEVIEVEICSETKKKATEICSPEREIFLKDNQPIENCDLHKSSLSRFKNY